jgi:hypothetical protein
MASASNQNRTPKKPQRKIDAGNFVESRKTWQPDWEAMEADIEAINRQLRRADAKPIKRKKSA